MGQNSSADWEVRAYIYRYFHNFDQFSPFFINFLHLHQFSPFFIDCFHLWNILKPEKNTYYSQNSSSQAMAAQTSSFGVTVAYRLYVQYQIVGSEIYC